MKNLKFITKPAIVGCALLVAVIFCGCENNIEKKPVNKVQTVEYGVAQVLIVDDCEYVVWNYLYAGGIVHKQNCKYCVERSKK